MTKSKRHKRKALKKELYSQKRELEKQIATPTNAESGRLVYHEGELYSKVQLEAKKQLQRVNNRLVALRRIPMWRCNPR
jgi:hypothetical protein